MCLSKLRLPVLFTLVATLTMSGFPLVQRSQALGQTPDIWQRNSPGSGNGGNQANKISILETQPRSQGLVLKTLVAQNKTDVALEVAERGRARAFVELLQSQNSAPQQVTSPTAESIKRIAKEHQATLVSYSIIYDPVPGQGEGKTQESELYSWVVTPSGEITFRRADLKPLLQQNKSLSDLVASVRRSIGMSNSSESFRSNVEKSQAKTSQKSAASKGELRAEPRTGEPSTPSTKGLQQLHQVLIQPIADLLPKNPSDRVVFIPQDSLFLVPFATLQDASGKYLIEQHSISTVPSIQVLDFTRQQQQRVENGDYLIVGNPTTGSISLRPGEPPQQLPPLPGAEQEAKDIAQLLKTQALVGKEATKASVLEKMPKARIIHLATQAIVDKERGMGSAIALTPSGNDNGLLTAEEIQNLKLNAELVVLSGCETGLGKITGDGVVGLARSFIAAGASSVVVSLGSVPDMPTAFLMTEFYRHLQQKQGKAQALRSAMLATRQKYPNPRDWGDFTLIGEPD